MEEKEREEIMPRKKRRKKNNSRFAILPTFGFAASAFTKTEGQYASLGEYLINFATGTWALDANSIRNLCQDTVAQYTGFKPYAVGGGWSFPSAWLPIIAGNIGSKIMSKIGANRIIRQVPLIGKHVKF